MKESTYSMLGVLTVLMLLSALFCVAMQRDNLKAEAVEKGFAEWVVTSHGNATWKWKEKP